MSFLKGYKTDEKNPLLGKWGFNGCDAGKPDSQGCRALEARRRELISTLQKSWDDLPDTQQEYFKDVLDYERAWYRGEVKDWRMFWKQPQSAIKEEKSLDLDSAWWKSKAAGEVVHPTDMQALERKPTSVSPAVNKQKIHDMLEEAGLLR